MQNIIHQHLALLDSQRETAFAALANITDAQLWQRPVFTLRIGIYLYQLHFDDVLKLASYYRS